MPLILFWWLSSSTFPSIEFPYTRYHSFLFSFSFPSLSHSLMISRLALFCSCFTSFDFSFLFFHSYVTFINGVLYPWTVSFLLIPLAFSSHVFDVAHILRHLLSSDVFFSPPFSCNCPEAFSFSVRVLLLEETCRHKKTNLAISFFLFLSRILFIKCTFDSFNPLNLL